MKYQWRLTFKELNCDFFFFKEMNVWSSWKCLSLGSVHKPGWIGGRRRSVDCVVMREAEERQGAAESAGPPTYHTPNSPKILLEDKRGVFRSIRLFPSIYSWASCAGGICTQRQWKCGDHFCSFSPLLQKLIKFWRRKRQSNGKVIVIYSSIVQWCVWWCSVTSTMRVTIQSCCYLSACLD